MSFKDDFVEALRSVKRDFFHDSEDSEPQQAQPQPAAQPVSHEPVQPQQPEVSAAAEDVYDAVQDQPDTYVSGDSGDVMEAYRQASAIEDEDGYEDEDEDTSAPAPYRSYTPQGGYGDDGLEQSAAGLYDHGASRAYIDFGDNGLYDDDKTIISKNTIIRGTVETDDSIRMLGQVMGDIDCKANIVVAGKVRGNTSAANAYIFDAQVDGDVRCEDVITVSNDAWVLGNLRAQQAEIDGKVKGNMEIRHMVSIGASSSVLGDISTNELEIKRGAFINGQIMMYSPSRDVLDRFESFGE